MASFSFWRAVARAVALSAEGAERKTHFLLIVSDDQGCSDLGCAGQIDSSSGGGDFSLATDIAETRDLSQAEPAIAARMQSRLEAWRREMGAREPRGPFRDF